MPFLFVVLVVSLWFTSLTSAHKKSSRKSTRPRGAKDAKPFRERLDAISLAPSGRSSSVSGSSKRRGVCRSDSASFRAALAAAKTARRKPHGPATSDPTTWLRRVVFW